MRRCTWDSTSADSSLHCSKLVLEGANIFPAAQESFRAQGMSLCTKLLAMINTECTDADITVVGRSATPASTEAQLSTPPGHNSQIQHCQCQGRFRAGTQNSGLGYREQVLCLRRRLRETKLRMSTAHPWANWVTTYCPLAQAAYTCSNVPACGRWQQDTGGAACPQRALILKDV